MPSGKQLTLLNHEYILRQLNAEYPNLYEVTSRIVSLEARRAENLPDEWERGVLESYRRGERSEVIEFTSRDAKPILRLMQPLSVQESCLKCHAAQGYQTGELHGGVSIVLPISQMVTYEQQVVLSQDLYLGSVWLCGIALILLSTQVVKKQNQGRIQAEKALVASEGRYRALYEDSPISLWEEDFSEVKRRIDAL